jgi:hypothetical protein
MGGNLEVEVLYWLGRLRFFQLDAQLDAQLDRRSRLVQAAPLRDNSENMSCG